jgi:antitoxin CptB
MNESLGQDREAMRRKILWKCRRGTKELDVILERFILKYFEKLEQNEIDLFNQLLDVEDPLLTEWLCFSGKPKSQGMEKIVTRILSADIN